MTIGSELRDTARRLLSEGTVELVIGWRRGSRPTAAAPAFVTDPEEAGSLVFDGTCGTNPAVYFTRDRRRYAGRKVGVAVKGCDARAVLQLVMENQVVRDDVVLIGVACPGVLDRRLVALAAGGREILELEDRGAEVMLRGAGFETVVRREDILSDACRGCPHPDPGSVDLLLGTPRREAASGEERERRVREFEALPPAGRWEATLREYGKCIRCYACRNVCPACYCETCFVDQNDPRWIGGTCEPTDTLIFHLIRNLHVAGRCVECGACARACPTGVDLLLLHRKVAVEILERFREEAGMDAGARPIMASFREDERQEFIMG